MNLKSVLSYFFKHYQNYSTQKRIPYKDNSLVHMAYHIKDYFTQLNLFPGFSIDASVGKGRWTMTPWIRIYDPTYAPKPTAGIYLVYLFSNDMSRVYLSLNRGVTKFKAKPGRTKAASLISSAIYSRKKLLNYERIHNLSNFNSFTDVTDKAIDLDSLNIASAQSNTKEYEDANILSIEYIKSDVLNNKNEKLVHDLQLMSKLYRELLRSNPSPNSDAAKKYYQLKGQPIIQVNIPGNKHKAHHHFHTSASPVPHNYLHIHKNDMTIGEYGENIIMKIEQHKYADKPYAEIRHASKDTNDHADYDIDVYNKRKDIILEKIEVKSTTSSNRHAPFHISKNEVACLSHDPNKYVLARVYNLNKRKSPIKYFLMTGNYLLKHFDFKPTSYQVSFKNE